jgi:hypothetical protein
MLSHSTPMQAGSLTSTCTQELQRSPVFSRFPSSQVKIKSSSLVFQQHSIHKLSGQLDEYSVIQVDSWNRRIRGQGDATIHDVVVSGPLNAKSKPKSDVLTALYLEKEWLTNALSRRTKALLAADAFLDTLNAQHFDFAQLGPVMETYDAVSEKLSVRITDLRRRLRETEEEIQAQEDHMEEEEAKLGITVAIGVFAANPGQVKLVLTYGVSVDLFFLAIDQTVRSYAAVRSANWDAAYEIRVDMNKNDHPVTLIYKAAITQNTGEVRLI